jgi:transposase
VKKKGYVLDSFALLAYLQPDLRRYFRCTACGYENDSDLTAAGNILMKGLTTAELAGSNACGDERPLLSVKQEPAGNRKGILPAYID